MNGWIDQWSGIHGRMFFNKGRVNINPNPGTRRDGDLPVLHLQRRGGAFKRDMGAVPFEFVVFSCIGQHGNKMAVVEVAEGAT